MRWVRGIARFTLGNLNLFFYQKMSWLWRQRMGCGEGYRGSSQRGVRGKGEWLMKKKLGLAPKEERCIECGKPMYKRGILLAELTLGPTTSMVTRSMTYCKNPNCGRFELITAYVGYEV